MVAAADMICPGLSDLSNAGRGHLVRTIVDGGLCLFHDLLNSEEVILGPQVIQRWQLILRSWSINLHLRASPAKRASTMVFSHSSMAHK